MFRNASRRTRNFKTIYQLQKCTLHLLRGTLHIVHGPRLWKTNRTNQKQISKTKNSSKWRSIQSYLTNSIRFGLGAQEAVSSLRFSPTTNGCCSLRPEAHVASFKAEGSHESRVNTLTSTTTHLSASPH